MVVSVSKTELARRTREIVEMARRESAVLVESFGEEQVVVVDALDYRLLGALARVGTLSGTRRETPAGLDEAQMREVVARVGGDVQAGWDLAIGAYMRGDISLGRAAVLLGLSRFDLARRLNRVGGPAPQSPRDVEEARGDLAALER